MSYSMNASLVSPSMVSGGRSTPGMLLSIHLNPAGDGLVWPYFTENYAEFERIFGGTSLLGYILLETFGREASREMHDEMTAFFADKEVSVDCRRRGTHALCCSCDKTPNYSPRRWRTFV